MGTAPRIVVVGLGYVGLPLAVALARQFDTVGLDVDRGRVEELRSGQDRTREVDEAELRSSNLRLTHDAQECAGADIYIVTVPTPVDDANRPDLGAVLAATRTIAGLLDRERRSTIVYESTVYPGVTEDVCGPEIERVSGLQRGSDFRLGYSPERINPGDREHSIERIVKVIAGEDEEVLEQLAHIYGAVTSAGVFRASSIKAAEAAKAIENAQRDINIAFVNEVTQICARIDVSVWDVLEAARTKWNFLDFRPGLVGGHCIGVDPYYLSHLAQHVGHNPQVILAGRDTNDTMGRWIVDRLHARRGGKPGRALVMGLTFKENVPDLRNSRSADLVERLEELGYEVALADPVADFGEVARTYGRAPIALPAGGFDLIVAAVRHSVYEALAPAELEAMVAPGGLVADIKAMWRSRRGEFSRDYWGL